MLAVYCQLVPWLLSVLNNQLHKNGYISKKFTNFFDLFYFFELLSVRFCLHELFGFFNRLGKWSIVCFWHFDICEGSHEAKCSHCNIRQPLFFIILSFWYDFMWHNDEKIHTQYCFILRTSGVKIVAMDPKSARIESALPRISVGKSSPV